MNKYHFNVMPGDQTCTSTIVNSWLGIKQTLVTFNVMAGDQTCTSNILKSWLGIKQTLIPF